MNKLYIFNPEHDLALAAGLSNFTAPHAGRQLRTDLGYLPAVWASAGDYVLVENVEDARTAYVRTMHRRFDGFVEKRQLSRLAIGAVEPWGWDAALRAFLIRHGVGESLLPTVSEIDTIRNLSHRRFAASLLPQLRVGGTVGESMMADSLSAISQYLQQKGRIVLKAPWSSSGRGIRFVDVEAGMLNIERWADNVISRQGCLVMEPYYNKVKDFGMEFESDGEGNVRYLGLSLFHTSNGAYTGNILASEEDKRDVLSRYISVDLLDAVRQKIESLTGGLLRGQYRGPFGVDMMLVRGEAVDGLCIHPCVEINLRRTMGHVALALAPREGVMRIVYTDNRYKLKIRKL